MKRAFPDARITYGCPFLVIRIFRVEGRLRLTFFADLYFLRFGAFAVLRVLRLVGLLRAEAFLRKDDFFRLVFAAAFLRRFLTALTATVLAPTRVAPTTAPPTAAAAGFPDIPEETLETKVRTLVIPSERDDILPKVTL